MALFLFIIAGMSVGWILNIYIARYSNEKHSLCEKKPCCYISMAIVNTIGCLLVYNIFGFTTRGLTGLFLFSLMLTITAIDLKKHIIPNGAVLFIIIIGIINHLFVKEITFANRLIGLFIGLFTPYLMAVLSRGGIGGGDIKLLGAMGFWVGFPGILYVFFISSLVGGIISLFLLGIGKKKKKDSIAFAPFLVVGFLLIFFFPTYFRGWY